MAPKSKGHVPGAIQQALAGFEDHGKEDVQDWSAQTGFEFEPLLAALVAADAGIMLRAGDHRRAVAVGVFAGGASAWQTCRNTAELSSVLAEAQTTLEALVGARQAPEPTNKGRRAGKGRS